MEDKIRPLPLGPVYMQCPGCPLPSLLNSLLFTDKDVSRKKTKCCALFLRPKPMSPAEEGEITLSIESVRVSKVDVSSFFGDSDYNDVLLGHTSERVFC